MNGDEVADKPVPGCSKIEQNKPVPKCSKREEGVRRGGNGGEEVRWRGRGVVSGRGGIICCFRLSERVSCVHHWVMPEAVGIIPLRRRREYEVHGLDRSMAGKLRAPVRQSAHIRTL